MNCKNYIMTVIVLFGLLSGVFANDGVFYANGGFLVPVQETDVSAEKEVLTITLGADGYATVDVFYEFMNNGNPKTVLMAFEADAPYNTQARLNKKGVHPFISDFTVTMNNVPLMCCNAVVRKTYDNNGKVDLTPLDMTEWKGYGEVADDLLPMDDAIYNVRTDECVGYAYAYYFSAPFVTGRNIVRHTYRYRMSTGVGARVQIPYWLMPATRWANGQVDDFTLRIMSEENVMRICFEDSVFLNAPFEVKDGIGEVYRFSTCRYGNVHYTFAEVHNGILEWCGRDFRPSKNITIYSDDYLINQFYDNETDVVVNDSADLQGLFIGDCGDTYLVMLQDYGVVPKKGNSVVRYSAREGQGFLCVDTTDSTTTVLVHTSTDDHSPVVGSIKEKLGDLPKKYRCLGYNSVKGKDGLYDFWYKILFDGKKGYVRADKMVWSPF